MECISGDLAGIIAARSCFTSSRRLRPRIGMLFPFAKDDKERDQMMASIAPFWDGNETWLVMGGVGLLVAFPLAYAIVMPALYLPVIVMLLALVFRGVAFEFREIGTNKALWNTAFAAARCSRALRKA